MYICIDELVAVLKASGVDADRLTDVKEMLQVLGGERSKVDSELVLRDMAAELAAFFDRHKYRLNVRCQGECLTCPTGTLIWCGSLQLPKAREVLDGDEEVSEVGSKRD